MKKTYYFFLVLFFLGCAQMRDYTRVKDGAFSLCTERGFGEGEYNKDYYLINDSLALIVNDTKNEVKSKIGLPHRVERTLDGYEVWTYPQKRLELFFKGERLSLWHEF